jgi:DNA replication and repair protein RecF
VARAGCTGGFAIHARVEGAHGGAEIGTGTVSSTGSAEPVRKVRIHGATVRAADELLHWLRIVWITPAMDGLFTGAAGERRRFLDRLVLAIDPAHGRRSADYERAMKSRNQLLEQGSRNSAWFEAIETQMAETGTAIAAARLELVRLLSRKMEELTRIGPFPAAGLALTGLLEELLASRPAVEAETAFRDELAAHRERDRTAGRTLIGPHRSDLVVTHLGKSMPAALCSTGEQKALLVGAVLSHARLTGEIAGMAPILLLDEIGAHLDARRRQALFEILEALNCQLFATGTDPELFRQAGPHAQFLQVHDGSVRPAAY